MTSAGKAFKEENQGVTDSDEAAQQNHDQNSKSYSDKMVTLAESFNDLHISEEQVLEERKLKWKKEFGETFHSLLRLEQERRNKIVENFCISFQQFYKQFIEIKKNVKVDKDSDAAIGKHLEYINSVLKRTADNSSNVSDVKTCEQILRKIKMTVNCWEKQKNDSNKGEQLDNRYVCSKTFVYYLDLKKALIKITEECKHLSEKDEYKALRFQCKKSVNIPINAISAQDSSHMRDKFKKLTKALDKQSAAELCSKHPEVADQVIPYTIGVIARKFISQGEHTVSSKADAAYPIASIIVALWLRYPKLGEVLLAIMMEKCPYIIPAYYPQTEGQSDKEHYMLLGYMYSDDSKVEEQNMFLKRMKGLIRLYAAIMITPVREIDKRSAYKHPYGIRYAWRWLAATLNLDPYPDITATLIYEFLEVTSHQMSVYYGKQFLKLLRVLWLEYVPAIEKVTLEGCQGPVVRLKLLLEQYIEKGCIEPPQGIIDSNFW